MKRAFSDFSLNSIYNKTRKVDGDQGRDSGTGKKWLKENNQSLNTRYQTMNKKKFLFFPNLVAVNVLMTLKMEQTIAVLNQIKFVFKIHLSTPPPQLHACPGS